MGMMKKNRDDTPAYIKHTTNEVSTIATTENSRILKKLSLNLLKGKKLLNENEKPSILDEKNIIDE